MNDAVEFLLSGQAIPMVTKNAVHQTLFLFFTFYWYIVNICFNSKHLLNKPLQRRLARKRRHLNNNILNHNHNNSNLTTTNLFLL